MNEIIEAVKTAVIPYIAPLVGAVMALALGWFRSIAQRDIARVAATLSEKESVYTGDRGKQKMDTAVEHFNDFTSMATRPVFGSVRDLIEREVPQARTSVRPPPSDDNAPTQ